MDRETDFRKQSGAPEAGGATTRHSAWGGRDFIASLWRFLARIARDLETTAYRRLKDRDARRGGGPGAPKRTKEAAKVTGKPIPEA